MELVFSNSMDISMLRGDPFVLHEDPFHPIILLPLRELLYEDVKASSGFSKCLDFYKTN